MRTAPPLTPGSTLFSDGIDGGEELDFVRHYVIDFAEALLVLPDGRELGVNVRTGAPDGTFDLSLMLSPEQLKN